MQFIPLPKNSLAFSRFFCLSLIGGVIFFSGISINNSPYSSLFPLPHFLNSPHPRKEFPMLNWLTSYFNKKSPQTTATFLTCPYPMNENPDEHLRRNRHWVYVAVRAISGRIAGTPLRFVRKDANGNSSPLPWDHPLPKLFREVNPFDTAISLWMKTVESLELTGNAYWKIDADENGLPIALWPLPASGMRIIPSDVSFIEGYEWRWGTRTLRFAADEIVRIVYPSPESPYYGASPLAAAMDSVKSHEAMKEAERRSFENGAFPGLALTTEEKLSPDARIRLEEQFSQHYAGPHRAGRAIVLEQGLKLRPFTFSPREMDFLESSKLARDEILAVFGVPAAAAGIAEDVNRSSADGVLQAFAENTILPKLRLIEAQLTQDICCLFGDDCAAVFDNPLPSSRQQDREDMIARLQNGITTPEEERKRMGL